MKLNGKHFKDGDKTFVVVTVKRNGTCRTKEVLPTGGWSDVVVIRNTSDIESIVFDAWKQK